VNLRCPSDRAVLTRPEMRHLLCRDFHEATRQGAPRTLAS
jgi:hypothetical protein